METIVKTVHQIRSIIVDVAVSGTWVITCPILFVFLFLIFFPKMNNVKIVNEIIVKIGKNISVTGNK